jgi:hypothetical protein
MVSESQFGSGLGAAGDLLGGIGGFMSGMDQEKQFKYAARMTEEQTAMRQMMSDRQGLMIQGAAKAQIGASGIEQTGSAQSVLRMNAQQIALNKGIIGQQGAYEAASWLAKAKAASTGAWTSLASGVLNAGADAFSGGLL